MKNNNSNLNLDALASQLGELKPASSHTIQGDVFYRAGFAAAKQEAKIERHGQFRNLCAASLLFAFTFGFGGYYVGSLENNSTVLAQRPENIESLVTDVTQQVDSLPSRTFSNLSPTPELASSIQPAIAINDLVSTESADPFVLPWVRWAQNRWGNHLGVLASNDQEAFSRIMDSVPVRKVKRRKAFKSSAPSWQPPGWDPTELYPSRFDSPAIGINRMFPML